MVTILFLAIVGLWLSWHIYRKKAKDENLVCIIWADCNAVVRSKYGNLVGVPNEILGIAYYSFVIAVALFSFGGIEMLGGFSLVLVLFFATGIAVLFSLFLIYIQAFVLRRWCEYCLTEAGINIAILTLQAIPLLKLYGFL